MELKDWVKERIATASGDGALVAGGERARHQSTKAMNALYAHDEFQEDRATWDDFHLYNAAGKVALEESDMATSYFKLLKRLEHLFGLGQGRRLHRAVAASLGQQHFRLAAMCGHRKMGYFAGVPQRFLQTFEAVYRALVIRQSHALDSRGSHSFQDLRQLGEQLANLPTIVFALSLHGELETNVAKMNKQTQFAGDLPWVRWRAFKAVCQSHASHAQNLQTLRQWLRIVVLVCL